MHIYTFTEISGLTNGKKKLSINGKAIRSSVLVAFVVVAGTASPVWPIAVSLDVLIS